MIEFSFGILRFAFRLSDFLRRKVNLRFAVLGGLKVGKKTIFVGSQSFGTEPYLIKIGNSCLITDGVSFLTHDGSIQVPLINDGESIDDIYSKKSTFSKIEVGDNVFIGINSILLPGTKISSNSIFGAGSVVKGIFNDGVVIAGNPAVVICSLEHYKHKNYPRILSFVDKSQNRKEIILKSCTS
jgi:acetyltransferase-like isoleucine patch superfamily enzyme